MATLNEEETAFAKQMKPQDIPAKLRCGMCDNLAVNAVKLPCCETSICADCQAKLTEQCPICEHSPVSADACTPMKSLRMTIKAHLKTEMKRRAAAAAAAAVPPPSKEPTPTPVPAEDSQPTGASDQEQTESQTVQTTEISERSIELKELVTLFDGSVEPTEGAPGDDTNPNSSEDKAQDLENADEELDDDMADDKSDIEIITERPANEIQTNGETQGQDTGEQEEKQLQDENMNLLKEQANGQANYNGFDQNQQGFNGMDFNTMANFNPMLAMQGMGMPNFGMGGMPNMMGMPGMNMMDPSMMMNQMNQFGGMGDMNMMASMMGGGYGGMPGQMGGPNGFGNAAGGYNRFGMNYNQPQQQQMPFHHNARGFNRPYGRGFQSRGRGGYGFDGRGGRGGAGFNQFGPNGPNQNRFQQQQNGFPQSVGQNGFPVQQQDMPAQSIENGSAEPGARRGSPVYESMKSAEAGSVDNVMQPREAKGNTEDADKAGIEHTDTGDDEDGNKAGENDLKPDQVRPNGDSENAAIDAPDANMADHGAEDNLFNVNADGSQPNGGLQAIPSFHGNGPYGNFQPIQPVAHVVPPVNAPTGPKAMRQGLPNNGRFSRPQPSLPPTQPNGHEKEIPTGPSAVRGRSVNKEEHRDERGKDDERSRSRSKQKSRRHRREDDDYESDATYERRKERERRKRKDRERSERDSGRSNGKPRSRSASPAEDSSSRRHRHHDDEKRSRRDRSREKRKSNHREEDEDDSSSRRKSKSHRSRDELEDRTREKDKSSRRREDEDRKDRSSKHSRHPSRDRDRSSRPSVTEQPSSDDIGFKIKGSHSNKINPRGMPPPSRSRHQSTSTETAKPKSVSSSDPYAEERERHKLERALKEQQRRQSTSLGKRGREGGEEGEKKRGRKISAKYEDEIAVGDGEREREAGRWR